TEDILAKTFEGAPSEMAAEYCDAMGITLNAFGFDISALTSVIILAVCGVVFLAIGTAVTAKSKKTDR
ncbi:MAG: hypothetical protein ACI4JZ_05180, partial [Oscillospiraceae bacterium]